MTDLLPAPVPELSDEWVASHRAALLDCLPNRSARKRAPLAIIGTTGAAVVAATLVAVFGGTEPYAFAGWTAAPTAPAAGQVQDAQAVCQERLDQVGSTPKGTPIPPLTPMLEDVRGPYTITVFGDHGNDLALCISAPGSESLRWVISPTPPQTPMDIAVDQVSFLVRDGQPYTLAMGRVGPGVTGVTLGLDDAQSIRATTGNGLFVAWWPGDQGIRTATVNSATGATIQPLNLPGPQVPPPPGTKPA
jgi:hypothetical protein